MPKQSMAAIEAMATTMNSSRSAGSRGSGEGAAGSPAPSVMRLLQLPGAVAHLEVELVALVQAPLDARDPAVRDAGMVLVHRRQNLISLDRLPHLARGPVDLRQLVLA